MQRIRRFIISRFRRHVVATAESVRNAAVHACAGVGYGNVGIWGEQRATRQLRRSGILLLQRNWHHQTLEADIIALEGRTLILAEVKTRHARLQKHYPGRGALTPRKQHHLRKLLRAYVRNHGPLLRRLGITKHRIDTIEVYYTSGLYRQFSEAGLLWERNSVSLQPKNDLQDR
jgi:putative endonuclease